ncbi:hypothetical protein [Nocardioides sp. Kera G14]|uniref:hypothetical protein n=1 Tax=Nocardioides sp. Kera G14 TaxID=2884264 RepID=UPI001D10AE0C|nr:hypothetical protein [Nocardioides sp. Kera G14]UDY23218.1 hypothetical protein LH076_14285 [Nocardioides sp. Kera G14]
MDTSTIIWIIVAVIIVAVLVGVLVALARRRREHKLVEHATELRTEAAQREQDLDEQRRQAQEAEAKAQLARAEAERAEEQARQARDSSMFEEAKQEDTFREADRVDPRTAPDTGRLLAGNWWVGSRTCCRSSPLCCVSP